MATRTRTTLTEYNKEELIAALKDTKSRIEATILSYQESVAKWKEEAPVKFAAFVETYDPDNGFYNPQIDQFKPPVLSQMCRDWRIQNLNKTIARIGLVEGNTVKLRADDEIWGYIGLGECL